MITISRAAATPNFPRLFENFERGKPSRSSHDSAAGMCRGAAHIEVADGSAVARPPGDRAEEEELLEREFALKDVALAEARGALDIERREELLADNDVFQIGRVFGNRVDDGVSEGFPLVVPVPFREPVRRVLNEAGKDVFAGRRDGRIGERGNHHINVGPTRTFAVLRIVVGALHVIHRRRNGNRAAKMAAGTRKAVEVRERVQSEIHLARRAAVFVALDFFKKFRRQLARFDESLKSEARIHARGNQAGANFFS